MARFQEVTGSVSKYYLSNTSWIQYASRGAFNQTTALRFKTEASNPFYLSYRTYNKGKGWLPYVSSKNVNDYAGYPSTDTRYVQSLGIRVIDSATGASLDSKYIVMYRAYANGQWQAWVSNANASIMQAVFNEFGLVGTLDTSSADAGLPGTSHLLERLEVRIFKDNGTATGGSGTSGGVVNTEKSYLVGDRWYTFTDWVKDTPIDGIKIQTSTSKDYYLLYKTWNEGRSSYYPAVTSIENDYAGYPNKPIQRINIQVCQRDGTPMGSGVIVMYRARIDGTWQDWVSNAEPKWMSFAQVKYGLEGGLNTTGTYAGMAGRNIDGFEIHIYEDSPTQNVPDYSESFRTERTRTILDYLGIDLNDNFGFEVQMTVPGWPIDVKYKVSRNTVIQPPAGVELVHYDIQNGEISTSVEDEVLDIYNELSATVTTGAEFTRPFFSFGFVVEIAEGKLSYGYKFTEEKLTFYYYIEEVLYKDDNVEYTQTYEFEISVSDDELRNNMASDVVYELLIQMLRERLLVGVKMVAVVTLVYAFALSAGVVTTGVASAVTAKFAMLILELVEKIDDNQGTV